MAEITKPGARGAYYKALGIPVGVPAEVIRAAYQRLASALHPDKHNGTPEANARFVEVTAAYAVLRNPRLRKIYDAQLALAGTICIACGGAGNVTKQVGFSKRGQLPCAACGGTGLGKG